MSLSCTLSALKFLISLVYLKSEMSFIAVLLMSNLLILLRFLIGEMSSMSVPEQLRFFRSDSS